MACVLLISPVPAVAAQSPRLDEGTAQQGASSLSPHGPLLEIPSLETIEPPELPSNVDLDVELQRLLIAGRDATLDRRYDDALELYRHAEYTHPGSAVGPLGRMLVYQAQMLENYDLANAGSYEEARRVARKRLRAASEQPGNESWEALLRGALRGMDGLHAMRQRHYVAAVREGLAAVRHLRKSRHASDLANHPPLHDVDLGLGGYDYFRSVVSRQAPWVPFMPDRREEGIAQIERAHRHGEFMRPLAQLALIFTFIDEGRADESILLAHQLLERYPENVLVRIQLGRALVREGQLAQAVDQYQRALASHPDNRIARYYLASALVRLRELDRAESVLTAFLEHAPTDETRGWAVELQGDIAWHRGNTDESGSPVARSAPARPARPDRQAKAEASQAGAEALSRGAPDQRLTGPTPPPRRERATLPSDPNNQVPRAVRQVDMSANTPVE